jgi:hypothetical protein
MAKKTIEITPATTVSDLLDTYPHLEETLIGIAPPFKKLRNPALRKSVSKVATISQTRLVLCREDHPLCC